ncbi:MULTISPECIES: SIMPL domain-containing protein [Alphaproteobacteria]|uniref:SIMPL domain-containing protein n=2 Tax=Alphaproteobacteria TaxID=28211 RepID=A0A512HEI1_9HYPH|nr:SIMPL domain-containing protein [Sphingomonas psychrolutea]GEO83859.1 SIMPL domain-containing protein [Ciceribacter naphthalenivorans]GLR21263.1 SIMPL domain-containing protein [Ciceribacter naphthalenivorans]GLT04119.1 SIMPL domain-containing protein [Sphingomonas psychrolutea]
MNHLKTTRLALAATLSCAFLLPLAALADDQSPREATIIVSGEGDAAIAPDMAILNLSVVREAETAEEALRANSQAMSEVLADLKTKSIAERDMQTSNFSVDPLYRQDKTDDGSYVAPVIVGYRVSNGLTLRVRDLTKLGTLIDAAVKLGVNQGGGITFTNDNPEAAITEARKKAVATAIEKAKVLTEAAGVKLGRVIEISENFARPMPQPMYRAAMAKEMSDAAPIAAGENQYTVTVNITYAIAQ